MQKTPWRQLHFQLIADYYTTTKQLLLVVRTAQCSNSTSHLYVFKPKQIVTNCTAGLLMGKRLLKSFQIQWKRLLQQDVSYFNLR